jgi:hypothetical protein
MDASQISAYLELFDLPDAFTEAQLKQAYHDLVQVWHPDKHSGNERLRKKADEKMKEINLAYQVLQSRLANGSFRFDRPKAQPAAPPPRPAPPHPAGAPEDPPASATARPEPTWLSGNAFWPIVIGVMLLIVIAGLRGQRPATPDLSQPASPLEEAELPAFPSIEGPQPGTNTVPAPISAALDSKYGFRELKLGMAIDEARRRSRPDRIITNQINQLVTFWYGPGPRNKLGDFPLDNVNASFFRGQLFKIEVSFSSNQAGMLDTLRGQFGASCPNDSLTRDAAPLRAECWFGHKAFCAIVAPWNSDRQTGWDEIVIYDQALNLDAQRFAAEEPLRAAQALGEDGFGEFKFGMTLKEFSQKLRRPPTVSDDGIGQKAAVIAGEGLKFGRYPLSSVRASFFQDKLFRLDLDFELHPKEIYAGFVQRFPAAAEDSTWSRNGDVLRARQFAGPRLIAAILAPRSSGAPWDCIVLYDRQADERRREFEREAPKRAARDL